MRVLVATLVLSAGAVAAPVPDERPPDPLAWGYLGVRVETGTLRIASVEPGTPAAKAGLAANDEFVKVGTLRPKEFEEVAKHISSFRPGSLLTVTFRRGARTKDVTVRLGARPADLASPYQKQTSPIPLP